MNLLFLISRFLDGGIDTVLVEVLRMLAEDKHYNITLAISVRMNELEVYHSRLPKNIKVEYLVSSPTLCNTKIRRFKKQSNPAEKVLDEIIINPFRRHLQQNALNRLVANNDVIIDFDACHTAFLRKCSKPTFAWIHFSLQKLLEQNKRRTQRIAKRLRQYDKVVLICKAMKEEADNLYPELKDKTVSIYNALDVDALKRRATEEINCNFRYILAVERLEESQKDLSTLLKAYSILDIPEHLIIIGKGKDEQKLKDYAESLGLAVSNDTDKEARVHFLGFQSNPHSWMARASLLVHSAKFEGFGLAIAEALLLGLPIVATDCPVGPNEILDNGKAGLLTPVGDAKAMADAIQHLINDEKLRENILIHAKEHGKNFTKETVKQQLDKLMPLT
ncbi:MAG: glycosyltransferase [Bacteroidaceae bacterium]|nr:glycosyltransferase [Bacteroidaceae bacterium]